MTARYLVAPAANVRHTVHRPPWLSNVLVVYKYNLWSRGMKQPMNIEYNWTHCFTNKSAHSIHGQFHPYWNICMSAFITYGTSIGTTSWLFGMLNPKCRIAKCCLRQMPTPPFLPPAVCVLVCFKQVYTVNDERKEFFGCISVEWNTADQELVQNDSHWPPVDRLACTHSSIAHKSLIIILTDGFSGPGMVIGAVYVCLFVWTKWRLR